jgi:hypothetical protein
VIKISKTTYLALRDDAEVVEKDGHGEKVLRRTDGTYLKLFRRKRFFSSAALVPYATRFERNTSALTARDIPCPEVIGVFRVEEIDRDVVHYHPLPGVTLREKQRRGLSDQEATDLRLKFNHLVRRLHDAGIYFRSLHLGNVVLTPEGRLGLIDISDLRVHRRPLSRFWRERNLQRMQGIESERDWLDRDVILGTHAIRPRQADPV